MSRPKNRDEYRQVLADEFAHVLEEHGLEWTREWTLSAGSNPPYNAVTKSRYRGSNAFYLSMLCMVKHYNDPRWVTMVQIMDKNSKYHLGQKWHLQAGSKAVWVEYWYPYDLIEKKALTWEQYKKALTQGGRSEEEFRLSTRYTPVYNTSMVDGMPPLEQKEITHEEIQPDELIEKLSENMGVPIHNDGGDSAFYRPSEDAIHLPEAKQFESEYAYNATALHELAHATGHPSRLDRDQSGGFGSPEYAYEELIAEMTACFMGVSLCAEASQHHIENHKAYVQGWIQSIRDKPETLIRAIKDAQRAADFMDYKAEVISLSEYEKRRGHVMEVPKQQLEKVQETTATHKPIGYIGYLGANGEIGERIEYEDAAKFLKDIEHENYYGVPMVIGLYADEQGRTIPQDFLMELDPIHVRVKVEPEPASRPSVLGRVSQKDAEVVYLGRESEPDRAYYFMAESLNCMTLAHITEHADHYVIIAPKSHLSAAWMDRHNIEFKKLGREITMEGTRELARQLGCTEELSVYNRPQIMTKRRNMMER